MSTEPTTEVNPANVAQYLERNGWFRSPETWRGAEVWATSTTSRQIMLPPEIVYRDDRVLVWRAVQDLAEVEQRDPQSLLRVFLRRMVDQQVFRTHPDTPSGTVPLVSASQAVDGIRSAFTAAARNVYSSDGPVSRSGKNSAAVKAFLDKVRLGPTEAGSYLFTTEVPVERQERQLSLDGADTGEARQIVDTLQRGVVHTARAVRATLESDLRDSEPFDTAFEQGVSSRLCQGLYQLAGHSHNRPFEIEFLWAPDRPADRLGHEPSHDRTAFDEDAGDVLKRAVQHLRILEYQGTVRVTGTIVAVEREGPDRSGYARVRGIVAAGREKGTRVLRVQISRRLYERAVRAHSANREVTVEGRIEMVGTRRELVPDRIDFGEKDGS